MNEAHLLVKQKCLYPFIQHLQQLYIYIWFDNRETDRERERERESERESERGYITLSQYRNVLKKKYKQITTIKYTSHPSVAVLTPIADLRTDQSNSHNIANKK